ncbi:MAG: hypothetical protein IPG66_06275 [Hydrogenophilales bacterium]|nr:hypothetical protein [Hydrogenophilales bacterium]
MMPLTMTDHARVRRQQRAIPPEVLDYLLDYGHWAHEARGADIVWFDQRARAQLKRQLPAPQYRALEAKLKAYAVVDTDGAIVTVGYRHRRINH